MRETIHVIYQPRHAAGRVRSGERFRPFQWAPRHAPSEAETEAIAQLRD